MAQQQPAPGRLSISSAAISRAEVDRAIDRGRSLQGQAMQKAFRYIASLLSGSLDLRGLRLPGHTLPKRHLPCWPAIR